MASDWSHDLSSVLMVVQMTSVLSVSLCPTSLPWFYSQEEKKGVIIYWPLEDLCGWSQSWMGKRQIILPVLPCTDGLSFNVPHLLHPTGGQTNWNSALLSVGHRDMGDNSTLSACLRQARHCAWWFAWPYFDPRNKYISLSPDEEAACQR